MRNWRGLEQNEILDSLYRVLFVTKGGGLYCSVSVVLLISDGAPGEVFLETRSHVSLTSGNDKGLKVCFF